MFLSTSSCTTLEMWFKSSFVACSFAVGTFSVHLTKMSFVLLQVSQKSSTFVQRFVTTSSKSTDHLATKCSFEIKGSLYFRKVLFMIVRVSNIYWSRNFIIYLSENIFQLFNFSSIVKRYEYQSFGNVQSIYYHN